MEDVGDRCNTIGGAGSIADNGNNIYPIFGKNFFFVNPDDGGRYPGSFGRSGEDDHFNAAANVKYGFLERGKGAGGLDDDFGPVFIPGNSGGISLSQDRNAKIFFGVLYKQVAEERIGIGDGIRFLNFLKGNVVRKRSVGSIIFQKIGPAGDPLRAGSVDGDQIGFVEVAFEPNAGRSAADTAKAVDGKIYHKGSNM
ncbi:MAG: hypothetical protein ACD_61C00154G0003 [uncultured bacterium]|nr:MAG: hypothetical protein ACD_61C00154G0003 [uncultured bacterium]